MLDVERALIFKDMKKESQFRSMLLKNNDMYYMRLKS